MPYVPVEERTPLVSVTRYVQHGGAILQPMAEVERPNHGVTQ
jgi:hypothetical protein